MFNADLACDVLSEENEKLETHRDQLVALAWKLAEENQRLKHELRQRVDLEKDRKSRDCLCSWTCELHRQAGEPCSVPVG